MLDVYENCDAHKHLATTKTTSTSALPALALVAWHLVADPSGVRISQLWH